MECDPEYGGQGMPAAAESFVSGTMQSAANMAFMMYPGLTHGAYSALHAHGTEDQKASAICPSLISGEWTGTMNLTEPHCGTDLGMLAHQGCAQRRWLSFHISGQKIFISSGEHDMADNIIHLVLAKICLTPLTG